MTDIAVQVKNLSKSYQIGRAAQQYTTLRDKISGLFSSSSSQGKKSTETIWALKDVSFEIKKGEVVGIIGRNGAGKSTLLKILSRITEPTEGFADIYGRVSSLLEVGTGFHQELTGRENIYLNAAILGMKKNEIDLKFDEIVAFAEIEKFIDTPVKHYSSGMHMRLAFAVAAHLAPDILLVDEVLAVGDAAFQKKCLGKLKDITQDGRAVLYVSHHLGQLRQLCQKGIWIDKGQVRYSGSIGDAVAQYDRSLNADKSAENLPDEDKEKEGFKNWRILNSQDPHTLQTEEKFEIEINLNLIHKLDYAAYAVILKSNDGANIASWSQKGLCLQPGYYRMVLKFPGLPVRPGVYYWYVSLWDGARKVDASHLHPQLSISTPLYSGLAEEWVGMVNVPFNLDIQKMS